MTHLALCLIVQLFLAFGVAGLMWPDRFLPLFGILMFPWPANMRVIRWNAIAAVGAYVLLVARLFIVGF